MFRKILKFTRLSAIWCLVFLLFSSNLAAMLLERAGLPQLAKQINIQEAQAATLTYVGGASCTGTAATYSCSLTGLTGGVGSSAQTGDLVIVVTGWTSTADGNPGVDTAGYTEINGVDYFANDTRDANVSFNYKIMGAIPDTSVTVRGFNNAANGGATVVQVWRNADQTTPLDVAMTAVTNNNGARPDSPSITPLTSGAVVLSAGFGTGDTTPLGFTAPTGYGNAVTAQGAGSSYGANAVVASKSWAGGAEDPAAWTGGETTTSDSRGAASIAIRPGNNPPVLTVTQPDGVGDTVTVGDSYNITYDLQDDEEAVTVNFYYDNDGVGLDGAAITDCQNQPEGTGAICAWNTTGMTPGSYYIYGTTTDGVNPTVSDYSPGQITINGPAEPDATGFTNNTEAGLTDGGRISQQITISGTNLAGGGTVTNKDTCTAGAANGCVRVADYTVPAGNISSWTDTSIVFTIPVAILVFGGSGTSCGGADGNGVCVTQNGNNDPGGALTFYVYPDITFISPSGAGEAVEGASVTISGNHFGASQGTGSVKFQACAGSDQTATVDLWGNTSISVTVPSGISDNDDSCNVLITRDSGTGSKTDLSNNFVVLPNITGMATCGAGIDRDSACGSNAAQEYAAGDPYGLIQLNGNHFGSSAGSISFTGGFGGLPGAVHGTAEGPCAAAGWDAAGTSVCLEVNAAIGNSIYDGAVTLSRNGDSKTDVIDLHILPRITSNVPSSGVVGDTIAINGDHFCQTGACPGSPPTADYIVYFGSAQPIASDFVATCSEASKWTDTQVCVKVPSGAPTGAQKTKIQGKLTPLYESQRKDFTVASTAPNDPGNLEQKKSDGVTVISVGNGVNGTTMVLEGDISAGTSITMFLEVEVKEIGAPFDGAVTASSTPQTGASFADQQATVSGLSDGAEYHWRARTKNANTGEVSNWLAFGDNPPGDGSGDGNPAIRDFFVDTSAPAISGVGAPPCITSQSNIMDTEATIIWTASDNFNENSIANSVRYGTDSELAAGTTLSATNGTNPTKTLTGLSPSTSYYYWVKSTDSVGNPNQTPAASPFCSFTTSAAVTRIMKTTEYYICQDVSTSPNWHGGGGVSCGSAGAKNFDVYAAEHRPSDSKPIVQKNAYIEIFGITNAASNFDVIVSVNDSASTTYTVASPGGSSLPWFILHPVSSFNIDYPADTSASSTLDIDFSGTINSTSLLGAKAVLTYYYTP